MTRRWAWVVMTGLTLGVAFGQEAVGAPLGFGEGRELFPLFGDRWASGGVEPTPAGVDDALDWLADQQHEDGSWGDVEVTAEALHAFVSVGHTLYRFVHQDTVKAAARWITEELEGRASSVATKAVSDARAAEVLAELYAATGRRVLRPVVRPLELLARMNAAVEDEIEGLSLDERVAIVSHTLVALRWLAVRDGGDELEAPAVLAARTWLDDALAQAPTLDPATAASAAVAALLHDPTRRRLEFSLRRFAGDASSDPRFELALGCLLAQQGDDRRYDRHAFSAIALSRQGADGSWPATHGDDAITSTALYVRALVADRRFARLVPDPPSAVTWPPPRPDGFGGIASRRSDARGAPHVGRLLEPIASAQAPDGSWSSSASTCRALIALLRAATTDKEGTHHESVENGVRWLIDQQHDDGRIHGSDGEHVLATMVLSDLYALTNRRMIRPLLGRAFVAGDALVARAILGPLDDARGDDDRLVIVGRHLQASADQPHLHVVSVDPTLLLSAVTWIDRHLASRTTVADDRLGALACAVLGATLVDPDRGRVERFFERYESAASPPRDLDSLAHIASLRAQLVDLTTDAWFLDLGVPDDVDDLSLDELVDTVRIVTSPYRYASVLEPR